MSDTKFAIKKVMGNECFVIWDKDDVHILPLFPYSVVFYLTFSGVLLEAKELIKRLRGKNENK